MATTKLWPIKGGSGSSGVVIKTLIEYIENPEKTEKEHFIQKSTNVEVEATVSNVINYTMQQKKTEEERFISAINCSVKNAISDMMDTRNHWKAPGNRVMWHGYQSFVPGEVTPEEAHEIGIKLAKELYGDRFEVVVATHLDRQHIHNHFVINAVSFLDGKKLDWDTYYPQMKLISDRLCKENDLSIVQENELSGHYHRGSVRAEAEGRTTLESIMIEDVDACIKKADSLKNFFQLMESKGYMIDTSRTYLRIYPPGHKKCIRLDRRMREKYNQGDAYTLEGIEERIFANLREKDTLQREEIGEQATYDASEYLDVSENVSGNVTDMFLNGTATYPLTLSDNQDDYYTIKGLSKGKEISGMGAYHIRYMMAMGVYPKRTVDSVAASHYYFREDILKLDKYINESRLLIDNGIETRQQLVEYRGEQIRKLQTLKNKRSKLQNKIRRCYDEFEKEELKSELKVMNKEIRQQKKLVYYASDIEESQKDMKRKINLVCSKGYGYEADTSTGAKMDIDVSSDA